MKQPKAQGVKTTHHALWGRKFQAVSSIQQRDRLLACEAISKTLVSRDIAQVPNGGCIKDEAVRILKQAEGDGATIVQCRYASIVPAT